MRANLARTDKYFLVGDLRTVINDGSELHLMARSFRAFGAASDRPDYDHNTVLFQPSTERDKAKF